VLLHRLHYALPGWNAAVERRDAQDEFHSAAQARAWADGDFDADHDFGLGGVGHPVHWSRLRRARILFCKGPTTKIGDPRGGWVGQSQRPNKKQGPGPDFIFPIKKMAFLIPPRRETPQNAARGENETRNRERSKSVFFFVKSRSFSTCSCFFL
jgi:hypothetical protein